MSKKPRCVAQMGLRAKELSGLEENVLRMRYGVYDIAGVLEGKPTGQSKQTRDLLARLERLARDRAGRVPGRPWVGHRLAFDKC